jgi:hypothetical protein
MTSIEELKRIADGATPNSGAITQTGSIVLWGKANAVKVSGYALNNRLSNIAGYLATFNPTLIKAMLREIEAARNLRDANKGAGGCVDRGPYLRKEYDKAREESGI